MEPEIPPNGDHSPVYGTPGALHAAAPASDVLYPDGKNVFSNPPASFTFTSYAAAPADAADDPASTSPPYRTLLNTHEVEALQRELEQTKAEITASRLEIGSLRTYHMNLATKATEMQSENEELQNMLAESNEKVQELQRTLDSTELKRTTLEALNRRTNAKLEAAQLEFEKQELKIQQQDEENTQLTSLLTLHTNTDESSQLKQQHAYDIAQLKQQHADGIAQLEAERANLQSQIMEQQDELYSNTVEYNELTTKFRAVKDDHDKLFVTSDKLRTYAEEQRDIAQGIKGRCDEETERVSIRYQQQIDDLIKQLRVHHDTSKDATTPWPISRVSRFTNHQSEDAETSLINHGNGKGSSAPSERHRRYSSGTSVLNDSSMIKALDLNKLK